jgi:hypothetical protein
MTEKQVQEKSRTGIILNCPYESNTPLKIRCQKTFIG